MTTPEQPRTAADGVRALADVLDTTHDAARRILETLQVRGWHIAAEARPAVASEQAASLASPDIIAPERLALTEEDEETCHLCGKPVAVVWTAPDEMWVTVTDRADGGGIVCVRCFDERAFAKGILLRWVPQLLDAAPAVDITHVYDATMTSPAPAVASEGLRERVAEAVTHGDMVGWPEARMLLKAALASAPVASEGLREATNSTTCPICDSTMIGDQTEKIIAFLDLHRGNAYRAALKRLADAADQPLTINSGDDSEWEELREAVEQAHAALASDAGRSVGALDGQCVSGHKHGIPHWHTEDIPPLDVERLARALPDELVSAVGLWGTGYDKPGRLREQIAAAIAAAYAAAERQGES